MQSKEMRLCFKRVWALSLASPSHRECTIDVPKSYCTQASIWDRDNNQDPTDNDVFLTMATPFPVRVQLGTIKGSSRLEEGASEEGDISLHCWEVSRTPLSGEKAQPLLFVKGKAAARTVFDTLWEGTTPQWVPRILQSPTIYANKMYEACLPWPRAVIICLGLRITTYEAFKKKYWCLNSTPKGLDQNLQG